MTSPKHSADLELAQRCAAGDNEAWEKLHRMYKNRIGALVGRLVGFQQAEDLTQDIFLLLWRKIGSYRGESALSTWVYRTSFNAALMSLRRKKIPTVSLEELMEGCDNVTVGDSFQAAVDDENLNWADIRMRLEKAIKEMPAGYRLHFLLHDLEGFQHKEIAQITNNCIGASKSQLHKARKHLRSQLRDVRVRK